MAQQEYQMDSVKVSCSICLDLLKYPVTIPCGHNYCMYCIGCFWDDEDKKEVYSCPQCRQTFTPRPVLVKNTMLAELVEDMKKTGLQAAPADHSSAEPEDVACDVCTGRKMKAVKSCLVCLVSYCENHLQPHYDVPGLKKHKLMNPSKKLQENICSRHDEVMKIFCRTDQQCICYLCTMDEHKGHETVPAAAERAEKQKELQVSRQQIQQRIQDRENDVKLLQQEVEAINASADKAVEDSEEIFTELIRLLQERSSDVKQQIRSQQETEVSRVQELQEKLEQEIPELKRKDAELEQLSDTEDHNQFLLNCPSLSALSESTHSSSIKTGPLRYFEDVTAAVSELRDKLQDVLRDPSKNISPTATKVDVLPQPSEPMRREDFLKYSRKVTLNPDTAHKYLELSEGNRKVTMTNENQCYEDHEDRFTKRWQVLSKSRLIGHWYWEVEWSGRSVEIAVAYEDIERTGDTADSSFGMNENSWALCCQPTHYHFTAMVHKVDIPVTAPVSSRVGVFLDHRAGILSFYSVSGSAMTLLHEVQTTFDQPLHAGIWLSRSKGTTAKIMKLFRGEMAQPGSRVDSVKFFCSICRELMKDPVTIPCGHSYCMNCIKDHWDGEDQRRIYSCPQCRKEFIPRPVLVKNITLAELVEDLQKTELQAAPGDHCYAGPEDVVCDVCIGRKRKAVKSCLVCMATYCENHLQPHYESPNFKKHNLIKVSTKSHQNICSRHDEVMKIFCRTDQQCICYLCTMDEHKGHETVPAAAERAEKQKELQVRRQHIQQRIQDREKDVKLLQQEVEAINASADKAVEDSEEIFTEMIRLLQERSSDVKQQIRSQQETEVSRVQELQEKLEQKITELKRKDTELEKLSNTEDHNQFLLNCPSLSALSESTHSSRIKIRPLRCFEDVTAAVSELRGIIQDVLRYAGTKISPRLLDFLGPKNTKTSLRVIKVGVVQSEPEPKTRNDFMKYSQEITLDPNTAFTDLLLSEGNRKTTLMKQQSYPDHPDRFTHSLQVLSRESLTGRCYWEVKWRGEGVHLAVAYRSIRRGGGSDESAFGRNNKSWALRCDKNSYQFWHNNTKTPVSGPISSTVGVFLDHRAGILSFYSVSETMTLLHRVQTTFTQPLHAGVWLFNYGTTAEFIKAK
ncbi:LOW QUALITY PROTEIN: uncharacterized protein FYW61_018982 [Anableps anableps]